jgi:hypothetical protein
MRKKIVRADKINLRVSGPLRSALEAEAAAEDRDLSSVVRRILINHTTQRVVERARETDRSRNDTRSTGASPP